MGNKIIKHYFHFTIIFFYTVSCSSLSHPTHGRIICSLGSDRVYSEGDKCFFTCNTGYRLTGSETRTCQSGRWSGSTTRCTRGEYSATYTEIVFFTSNSIIIIGDKYKILLNTV